MKQNGEIVTPILNKELIVENGQEFMLTAVPNKNSFNTRFSISYRTDGAKNQNAEIWAKIEEHKLSLLDKKDNSNLGLIIGLVVGVLVLMLIIIACLGMYKRRKR